MSWFDAKGFASLAKTALKEAQKTIDKALDIKDEEQRPPQLDSSSEFFSTWGVKDDIEKRQKDQESPVIQNQQSTSVWGSFTGSYFENQKDMTAISSKSSEIFKDSDQKVENFQLSTVMSTSLPESLDDFAKNKKGYSGITKSSTDPLDLSQSLYKTNILQEINTTLRENVDKTCNSIDLSNPLISLDQTDDAINQKSQESRPCNLEISESDKKQDNVICRQDKNTSHSINRLSVLSAESDKKSSTSFEVLGSRSNTDCSNTPDSDLNSVSDNSVSAGQKINSESVEVLPDSLVTSPSSVEILGEESPFVSPLDERHFETPFPNIIRSDSYAYNESIDGDDTKSSTSTLVDSSSTLKLNVQEKKEISNSNTSLASPESVEIIPDVEDADEVSLAEDSYTSVSEGNIITVVEGVHRQDLMKSKDIKSQEINIEKQMSTSSDSEYIMNSSLDSLKEKSNLAPLHLSLEAITRQPIRKQDSTNETQKQSETGSFDRLNSPVIEPKQNLKSPENFKSSDPCLLLTDSSCEETLIESSSEDNNGPNEVVKSVEPPLSTSSYVKHMLADAMSEKSEMNPDLERSDIELPRDISPVSSERSDLVKIGSDQTSGHTSGDELETTTSSDIEIISSPNGDSSSTQSRQSPAKIQLNKSSDLLTKTLKTRGHSRELSQVSVGSDDYNLEIERLLRRIREMTEILEARESKLIDVSRTNMELHEQNLNLKKQLDNVEKHVEHNQDLRQITDDYTQRLSALERKFQQAIRERDSLRKNLEQMKQEASNRLSTGEMSKIIVEKDEIIKELRDEGEKLSKQQLQHSNIIKKLRVKEKENDATIKSQKEQWEEQTVELERLKRSLQAKEEVERSQIEAVNTLTSKTKKQEKEILSLHEKLDHVSNKMEAYKKSFEAAKTELLETKEKLLNKENELKLAIENAGESNQLLNQVENLKIKLRKAEQTHIKKEDLLKQENLDILKRLEAAESRSEEMSESVSMTTKPLLRQLEQLQLSLSHKTNFYLRQEEIMTEKIADLQSKLENITESNRSLSEENANLKSRSSVLESKLKTKEENYSKTNEVYSLLKEENEKLINENESYRQKLKIIQDTHNAEISDLKREISLLENKLSIEKAATEAEKRKNQSMLDHQHSTDEELRYSPTLSIERDSVCSANSIWPPFNDSMFETGSGRFPNIYSTNSTSMIENLQAQLKQRDGEVQQLQWELSRRNTERDALNIEVSSLSSKVEDLNLSVSELESIKKNLNDIQTKYDALLQMYGEKVEETQELKLDLEDVKEMYKTQIDQLLKRET